MNRGLLRRVDRLEVGLEPVGILAAIETLAEGGTVLPGRAGERAMALWTESGQLSLLPEVRELWCVTKATGKGIIELLAESDS